MAADTKAADVAVSTGERGGDHKAKYANWGARLTVAGLLVGAFLLRVVDLENNPPGLYTDEASSGWNAYCILKTGRNEYNQFLPLSFPSIEVSDPDTGQLIGFHEYKGPLHIYSMVPAIALFGLNSFAVRLPAAVYGTLLVLVAYLLANRWFGSVGGVAAGLLLAVSPWALHYSRTGFGAATAVPVLGAGVYLFVTALERRKLLPVSVVCFGLAAREYAPCLLFCPLLMVVLALTYRRELSRHLPWAISWGLIGCAIISPAAWRFVRTPLVPKAVSPSAEARFANVSVFNSDARRKLASFETLRTGNPDLARSWVFHHWWSTAGYVFLRHWSPPFLLIHGDLNPRHSTTGYLFAPNAEPMPMVAGFGQLLWAEALLAVIGTGWAVRHFREPHAKLLLAWLLLWPLSASLTAEGIPHATRSLVSLPVWQILSGAGVAWCLSVKRHLKRRRFAALGCLGVAVLLWGIQVPVFLRSLYTQYPAMTRTAWDVHVPEIITYALTGEGKYRRCVVSPRMPEMNTYMSFYTHRDPRLHLAGRRPFMWSEPITTLHNEDVYLLRADDLYTPALIDAWARAGGVGIEEAKRQAPTLMRVAAEGGLGRINWRDNPYVMFVTAWGIRDAARTVFGHPRSNTNGRGAE